MKLSIKMPNINKEEIKKEDTTKLENLIEIEKETKQLLFRLMCERHFDNYTQTLNYLFEKLKAQEQTEARIKKDIEKWIDKNVCYWAKYDEYNDSSITFLPSTLTKALLKSLEEKKQ
jgi:hypothetical protein